MVVLTSECPNSSGTSFGAAPFANRLLPYNRREFSLFHPDDKTHSKRCFCLLLLCSSSCDVGRIWRIFKIKRNVEVTDNGKDDF